MNEVPGKEVSHILIGKKIIYAHNIFDLVIFYAFGRTVCKLEVWFLFGRAEVMASSNSQNKSTSCLVVENDDQIKEIASQTDRKEDELSDR